MKLLASSPRQPVYVVIEASVAAQIVAGTLTVGTATTTLASLAPNTPSSLRNKSGFTFRAGLSNTGIIYLGDSSVSATNGYPLGAGDSVFVAIEDLANIFAMASTSGQTLAYIGVT